MHLSRYIALFLVLSHTTSCHTANDNWIAFSYNICLSGNNDKILFGVSLDACKEACSDLTEFTCCSLEFVPEFCSLSFATVEKESSSVLAPCPGYASLVYFERSAPECQPDTTVADIVLTTKVTTEAVTTAPTTVVTTEDTTVTTQPTVVTTEDTTVTTQPTVVTTEDTTITTQPTVVTTEDTTITTQPTVVTTEDTTVTTQPTVVTTEDTTVTTQPTVVTTEDTTVTTQPTVVTTEDTTVTTQPTVVTTEDTTVTTQPTVVTTEDTTVTTQPTVVTTEDTPVTTQPTVVTTEDTTVTIQPTDVTAEDTTVTTDSSKYYTNATDLETITNLTSPSAITIFPSTELPFSFTPSLPSLPNTRIREYTTPHDFKETNQTTNTLPYQRQRPSLPPSVNVTEEKEEIVDSKYITTHVVIGCSFVVADLSFLLLILITDVPRILQHIHYLNGPYGRLFNIDQSRKKRRKALGY
ncbi:hypothetical protein CAPTEDRAFT_187816 [Capitella teleta]|uniref:Apple domain-containing protein n=1 Tax=Capitella teleta TaxID=283909 RepID=R7VKP7_CAPTE|nr:hypothetical protein CAPTEDRAFT_187816 [Capitella teleta]|eukprot:ELU17561.1 hypothetical protein CAPTEDRAFT_187816 [Capitella teleta]